MAYLSLYGCPTHVLSVDGEQFDLRIRSDTGWHVRSYPSWVSLSQTAGYLHDTIHVSVDIYTGEIRRQGSIIIEWEGGDRTCYLRQYPIPVYRFDVFQFAPSESFAWRLQSFYHLVMEKRGATYEQVIQAVIRQGRIETKKEDDTHYCKLVGPSVWEIVI